MRNTDARNSGLRLVAANPRPDGETGRRTAWKLSKAAFDSLLGAFDPDQETATELYLAARRDLIFFFEGRGFMEAADHADEVFDRAARRVEDGTEIADLRPYLFGIARFLLLELNRASRRRAEAYAANARENAATVASHAGGHDDEDWRLAALRECAAKLDEGKRRLIMLYYAGADQRKADYRERLAEDFGMKLPNLRVQVQRIRQKLETCVGIVMRRRQR